MSCLTPFLLQDHITPPSEMNCIRDRLLHSTPYVTTSTRVPEPYVVPDAGHLPMVLKPELVNPVISDFLIKNCGLETLSGEWQILHKTKGENKWDLKNYEKVKMAHHARCSFSIFLFSLF